jgi:signal transduction histidine kinase
MEAMFKSIRSRLSLSFAGIALIVALALGLILLAILQRYYSNMELGYLHQNAKAVSSFMTEMLTTNAPQAEVQSQVQNLAFLSQTRIQVYDQAGQFLYDSGMPQNVKVNLGAMNQSSAAGGVVPTGGVITVVSQGEGPLTPPNSNLPVTAAPNGVFVYHSVQASGSPFGFDLSAGTGSGDSRSTLVEIIPITDQQNASVIGTVELSQGPAYGSAVLTSVARAWAIASALAVLFAAAIGWYISRRISAPMLALTSMTAHMTQGDLSSRSALRSRDEIGQLAASFNEMADQVEATVTTLRRFVSDAAHELRTPLTALRTNLDLARDEKNAAKRAVFLSRAQAMVERLEELNTNLLDLSRLEANGHAAQGEIVDLGALLRPRAESYASQAEQAGLAFEVKLPEEPLRVRADGNQVLRAMDNLVDNACKFTPQGGNVRVELSAQDEQAVFSVADTGIGVPVEDLPQIFNRFHRGRNTTSYPGSGLGLAIVKAIVAANDGLVEVQSAGEGQGRQYTIKLSLAPADA